MGSSLIVRHLSVLNSALVLRKVWPLGAVSTLTMLMQMGMFTLFSPWVLLDSQPLGPQEFCALGPLWTSSGNGWPGMTNIAHVHYPIRLHFTNKSLKMQ